PSSPHSAALTVVPPKSIPILMIIPPFSCLRKNTQAPPAEIRVQPLHAAVDHQLFRKADLLEHLKRSFHMTDAVADMAVAVDRDRNLILFAQACNICAVFPAALADVQRSVVDLHDLAMLEIGRAHV